MSNEGEAEIGKVLCVCVGERLNLVVLLKIDRV